MPETQDADTDRTVTVETVAGTFTETVAADYELTQRKSFSSQADCMTAWEEQKFPTHNLQHDATHGVMAVSYSSENFRAYAHADGTGHVMHYDTLAAIRTRNGTVVNNQQDHATGFARVTRADDAAGRIPLSTIQDSGVLPDELDIYDITGVHTAQKLREDDRGGYTTEAWRIDYPKLIGLSDGSGLIQVKDPSAKNYDENTALFHASAEEIQACDTVAELETLLIPNAVKQDGREIVTTDQMVPESQYGRRAKYHDSRYEDRGEVIQRQGEWFFIPCDGDDGPNATISDQLPRECANCGATQFDVTDDETTCKQCGYRHIKSGNGRNRTTPLGNHHPTTYVGPQTPETTNALATDGGEAPNDENDAPSDVEAGYVKGTVRHTDDHYMARLGSTWHKAVTRDRDVVVVDTSTPNYGREGRGRSMRWD